MKKALSRTLDTLADKDIGWVNRRDAAMDLGTVGVEAVRTLKAYTEDTDRDVQRSIKQSLGDIAKAVQGFDPIDLSEGLPSLKRLVEALERKGARDITNADTPYEITVATKDGRSQKVHIEATKSNTDRGIIRVSTRCGEATEETHVWALTNNAHMSHCALAIESIDGESALVLVNNLLADTVSFQELKLTVKEVAFYGDWVEEKLSKEDIH